MSLGNVDLTLGLNTGPAQQSLNAYVQAMQGAAAKGAQSQKQVTETFKKQKDAIVNIRQEYDKNGKVIAIWHETQSQMNKRLAKEAKAAAEAQKKGTKATKDAGSAAKKTADQVKKVGAAGKVAGDTVEKEFNEAKGAMDRLGASAGTTAGKIRSGFQDAIKGIPQGVGLAIGQQLTQTLMTIPQAATAAAAGAVAAFTEIDRSLRQTLAISGADVEMFDELAAFMNDLAKETKFTADELAEASVQLARAGMSAQELQDALPGIAMGAAAAGESMAGMSDVVIAALGGFQLGANQASEVADVLTQAANNANTSVVELGEGLKYAAPIANSLGISLEDTSAVLGLLANKGIKASQAGTTLRSGLGRLARAAAGTNSEFSEYSRGTSRLSGVLRTMGADIKDTNGNLVAMPELLSKLREGFGQLEGTEKNLAASILFGEEAATGWVALLETNAQAVEGFFEKTNNAAGVAAETARKNLSGISGSLELLKSASGSVQAAFGKFLSEGLKPVIDGITALLNMFNSLPAPVQNTVMAITLLTGAVGALALAIGVLKALGVGAFFASVIGGAASAGMALTALAGTIGSQVMAAFAGLEIVMLRNVAGIQGSLIPSIAGLQAKLTTAAGASKALTIALAAMNLAAIAVAVAAVALVWDGWNQAMKEADATSKLFAENSKNVNKLIDEQTKALLENTNAWNISVERVGFWIAQFDKLNKLLGGATYEEVQLIQATERLGDEMAEFDTKLGGIRGEMSKLNGELKSGTLTNQEAAEAQKRLSELYKGATADVQAMKKGLEAQLRKLEETSIATGRLGEAEKLRINGLKAAISSLEAEERLLAAIAGNSNQAASGMNNFTSANDGAAASAARATAAIEKQKAAIDQLKAKQAADDKSFQNTERALAREEALRRRAAEAQIAQVQKANRAYLEGAKQRAEGIKRSNAAELKEIDQIGKARIEGLRQADAAAQKHHAAEMKRIASQIEALDRRREKALSGIDAQIDKLRELTPAEKELAEIERKKLEAAAQGTGEEALRARAQLERMEREKQIAAQEEQRAAQEKKFAEEKKKLEEEKAKAEEKAAKEKEKRAAEMAAAQKQHDNEMMARREAIAAQEQANADKLANMRASMAAAEAAMREEEQARQQAADDAKYEREEKNRQQREETLNKIEGMTKKLEEMEKAKDEGREVREQDYRKEIGQTNEMIVKDGDKAWTTYADNAVSELGRVEAAARAAAAAATNAAKAPANQTPRWAGGPLAQGQRATSVNEFGQEAFLSKSGMLSLIDRPAWSSWMAPESGTVIPASITAKLGIPPEGINLNAPPSGTAPAASVAARASGGQGAQLIRAISALKDSGGRITNNVSIESAQPVQAASDMMVELHKIRRRRLG